jgi:hypothetical protein
LDKTEHKSRSPIRAFPKGLFKVTCARQGRYDITRNALWWRRQKCVERTPDINQLKGLKKPPCLISNYQFVEPMIRDQCSRGENEVLASEAREARLNDSAANDVPNGTTWPNQNTKYFVPMPSTHSDLNGIPSTSIERCSIWNGRAVGL